MAISLMKILLLLFLIDLHSRLLNASSVVCIGLDTGDIVLWDLIKHEILFEFENTKLIWFTWF
jgi:hypothetical protein